VEGAGVGIPADAGALVWYLATTEWIFFSIPSVQFRIAEEVRRGDIAYQLTRPVSYLGAHYARALGQLCLRAPLVAGAAGSCAYFFAGAPPVGFEAMALAVAFGLCACAVGLAFKLLLGLAALWLEDAQPLYWVWNKLSFTLGGLMLPLAYCPPSLQNAAKFTPFPSLFYGPASLVLGQVAPRIRGLFLDLACWLLFAGLLAAIGFRRARSRLSVSGG
jgi:ABC-2 type transport system permease protein